MSPEVRNELYRKFIDFVSKDVQTERSRVNRRMLHVLFWCFLLPAAITIFSLFLIRLGILPRGVHVYLDWVVLVFPIFYSLYVLSSEVLTNIPSAFRRGGGASTLAQALKDGEWRSRVCESMRRTVEARTLDWKWLIINFKIDLEALQYRNKYLTALAGAVFFLLMQGIDSLTDDGGERVTYTKVPLLGYVETSGDLSQFAGLGLFLVLLYISGSQTYTSLNRYLDCAELVSQSLEDEGKR